jgi:hypothetical protein
MMHGKGCERKRSQTNLMYCPKICLEGLKKTTENLKIIGVPSEILTEHLLNTSLERYLYSVHIGNTV